MEGGTGEYFDQGGDGNFAQGFGTSGNMYHEARNELFSRESLEIAQNAFNMNQ